MPKESKTEPHCTGPMEAMPCLFHCRHNTWRPLQCAEHAADSCAVPNKPTLQNLARMLHQGHLFGMQMMDFELSLPMSLFPHTQGTQSEGLWLCSSKGETATELSHLWLQHKDGHQDLVLLLAYATVS
jgi:hypothetical protein